jgi:hypothetical protein
MEQPEDAEGAGRRQKQHPYDQQEEEHVFHEAKLGWRRMPVKDTRSG